MLSEYEFIKEGKKVGCGAMYKIGGFSRTSEAACKSKCDANKECTYLWSRQSSKKCVLYRSCDGQSEAYVGKRFKKKQGMKMKIFSFI